MILQLQAQCTLKNTHFADHFEAKRFIGLRGQVDHENLVADKIDDLQIVPRVNQPRQRVKNVPDAPRLARLVIFDAQNLLILIETPVNEHADRHRQQQIVQKMKAENLQSKRPRQRVPTRGERGLAQHERVARLRLGS